MGFSQEELKIEMEMGSGGFVKQDGDGHRFRRRLGFIENGGVEWGRRWEYSLRKSEGLKKVGVQFEIGEEDKV